MAEKTPPLPDDGIYRAILVVLVASVVIGAATSLAGELVWHNKAISQTGGWIVVVCGVLYFVFRWLGRREAARRAARGGHSGAQRRQEDENGGNG